MFILSDYTLVDKSNNIKSVISKQECFCPLCHSRLVHRDWKLRIMKLDGGAAVMLRIERGQCTNPDCHKLHNLLPDLLAPHKHYASEIIEGVLDETIVPDESEANEDYPCDETMRLWLRWFLLNMANMEGYCRRVGYLVLGMSEELFLSAASVLKAIRGSTERWLATILRVIYNSGGCLSSLGQQRAFAPTSF